MSTRVKDPNAHRSLLTCNLCAYKWLSKSGPRRPLVCPACLSRRWYWPKQLVDQLHSVKSDARARRAATTATKEQP